MASLVEPNRTLKQPPTLPQASGPQTNFIQDSPHFLPEGKASGRPMFDPSQERFMASNDMGMRQFQATGGQPQTGAQGSSPLHDLRGQTITPGTGSDRLAGIAGAVDQLAQRVSAGGSQLPQFQGANPQVQGLQQLLGQQAGGIFDAPDRQALAGQTFDLLRQQTEPQFQKELQGVGQKAAALGRIGAGMTTSELGDVQSNRERGLAQAQQGLSLQAAGQTLQDRIGQLGALGGVTGQLFGQDMAGQQQGLQHALAGAGLDESAFGAMTGLEHLQRGVEAGERQEMRGERGRADQMAEQANQSAIQQLQMQMQMQQQMLQQQLARAGMAGQFGFADPGMNQAAGQVGRVAGDQGQQLQQGGMDAMTQFFQNMTNANAPLGGAAGQGPGLSPNPPLAGIPPGAIGGPPMATPPPTRLSR